MSKKYVLKSVFDPSLSVILLNLQSKFIGRSPETNITDTKCSRKQVEVIADYEKKVITVKQLGCNSSFVNGEEIGYYESRTARNGDKIELLLDSYAFIAEIDDDGSIKKSNKRENIEEKMAANKVEKVCDWKEIEGDLIYYIDDDLNQNKKIASYDMDGTLITTQSGLVFPRDKDDWKILYSEIPKKLKDLSKDGYNIVIFSNQAGISSGKQTVKDIQYKFNQIIKRLGIKAQIFISTGRGKYRKPMTGMWEFFVEKCYGNEDLNMEKSFYVGDAAGRPEIKKVRKKDHSCSDRLFALNLDLEFYTPEQHFLGRKPLEYKLPDFNPRSLPKVPLLDPENTVVGKGTEVIILVGYPGCGKSTFAQTFLKKHGFVQANRDTVGSWQKCVGVMKDSLEKKQSVVIDNTNPDVESRKRYIDVAKQYDIAIRCFVFNLSVDHCKHNNKFRELSGSSHQKVNEMVYNSYKSKYQEPSIDEGYTDIVKVNFRPNFNSEAEEVLYKKYLLEK